MSVSYELSNMENNFNFIHDILNKFWKNLAINIFEWKGLEEISPSLTSEIIEETLFDKGCCLFFKDDKLGYMALPVAPANKLNVYSKPTNFIAIGMNYNKEYNIDNSVLIKNNSLKTPTSEAIDIYTRKMADIELTKDIRRNAHKTPFVIETTDTTLLTAKNFFKQVFSNEPAIYRNKTKGETDKGLNILNNDVDYLNDRLEDDYHNYEARILTILGLDNYVEDKKERVQSAEVESNQEYIISSFRASLEARKKACEAINKMFNLNLSVDYVKADQIESNEPSGEVDNE